MDYAALQSEIQNDPLELGYVTYTDGRDADLAALLNARSYTLDGYALISDIQSYVDSHGLRDGLETATSNPAAVAAVRLFSARYTEVQVTNAAFLAVLDGLIASGLCTSADKAAIVALGQSLASRAEVLWGAGTLVTAQDIAIALRG